MKISNYLLLTCFLILGCQTQQTITDSAAPTIKIEDSVRTFALDEITIDQLQQGYTSGTFTIEAITEQYLDRIEEIDKKSIQLNSVIAINPDAIAIARALDEELKNGQSRGPFT